MTSTADLIPISEKTSIPGSPDEVWPLLSDPNAVVLCVPGAAITAQRPDGTYEATITVKFGPTTARFSGEVIVNYDHAARHCNVEGRGIDQRGASRALVSLLVGIEGKDSSVLSVDGGFNVAGPLETFASAGGVHVARALLAEFAKNMAAVVETKRMQSPQASATALPQDKPVAAELHGGKLLWNAFLSWLSQLFQRRKH
jgi:carbon monoxide dehydrogenase subunit G